MSREGIKVKGFLPPSSSSPSCSHEVGSSMAAGGSTILPTTSASTSFLVPRSTLLSSSSSTNTNQSSHGPGSLTFEEETDVNYEDNCFPEETASRDLEEEEPRSFPRTWPSSPENPQEQHHKTRQTINSFLANSR